jgi:hypothetical protein
LPGLVLLVLLALLVGGKLRNLKNVVCFIIALMLMVGCAGMQTGETPEESYLVALTQYINLQDLYLRHEAKIEDAYAKGKIKDAFNRSAMALEMWGIALDSGGSTVAGEVTYERAMDFLIQILPSVIEIVGE